MLLKIDASGLEFRGAIDLSGDLVGIREINEGLDAHEDNRQRIGLPTRLIAKKFLFRILYGGSAYAFSNDSDFNSVSKRESFWQGAIDEFYNKYRGIAEWHNSLMHQAQMQGHIRLPTGREYHYTPTRDRKGELKWPRTTILNYPVQGYSADLMMIARISAWRRLRQQGLFIGTVHDDLELDVVNDAEVCYNISVVLEKAFEDIPANVKRIYGHEMKVPMQGEVSFGQNLKEMTKFNRNLDKEQFNVYI